MGLGARLARNVLGPAFTPMPATTVAAALRAGQLVSDQAFDRLYPTALRFLSFRYWTPVAVAARAAQLLAEAGATRVLDVGSGPGKFCITGALTQPVAFTGIERRPRLIEVARATAERTGAERARFVEADILRFPFARYDGFYIYNPFYEAVAPTALRIDDSVAHSPALYRQSVAGTARKLARLPIGVAVVTYHGLGGAMPSPYSRVHQETAGTDQLTLWVKIR
jgi:SAM-dependent methyltransferase